MMKTVAEAVHAVAVQTGGGWNIPLEIQTVDETGLPMTGLIRPIQALQNNTSAIIRLADAIEANNELLEEDDFEEEEEPAPKPRRKNGR